MGVVKKQLMWILFFWRPSITNCLIDWLIGGFILNCPTLPSSELRYLAKILALGHNNDWSSLLCFASAAGLYWLLFPSDEGRQCGPAPRASGNPPTQPPTILSTAQQWTMTMMMMMMMITMDDDDEDSTPQRCLVDQIAAASGSARKHKSGAMKYWMCWKHFN